MDAILQVENLTKHYPDFTLDHVSFSVPKGTIMGLIGENGAGKSTTINAILDLIHKDDGTVTFWGQELSSAKQLKEDIGVVFDGINFYETLTPAKVGKIARAAYSQWDNHLYQDYLKRFQLPLDKEFKQMSKGMKVKLCIYPEKYPAPSRRRSCMVTLEARLLHTAIPSALRIMADWK